MEEVVTLEWLLFFYSIPATPVNNRVKIWRKLAKTGAVQLKGGVYILPNKEEHHEVLQWLLAELPGLKGEGLLVTTDTIEPLQQVEIISLFNQQRNPEYQAITSKIDELSGRIRNLQKGGRDKKSISLFRQFEKLQTDYISVKQRDFFAAESGKPLSAQISLLRKQLEELSSPANRRTGGTSKQLPNGGKIGNISGMTWLTRKRPYVDRMASAWLIRRFIDDKATFGFRDEAELQAINSKQEFTYDVRNGDFTHIDDLCTFEVLLKSFRLEADGLNYLAGIVHDIDVKDGKFAAPEAHVVEMILKGIRKRGLSDDETLEQGMAIFEALYQAISEKPR